MKILYSACLIRKSPEDEYKKFELFPDDGLPSLSGKELKNRLDENHQNYVKVSEIHSFGVDFSKLENLFGEDGAKALSNPDWVQISFSDVKRYIESKKNKSAIEYLPIISNPTIWDKEKGTTKAKGTIRNILVFVDHTQDQVEIELFFSDFTKIIGINVPKAYHSFLTVTNIGKKLLIKISEIEDKTVFGRFRYERMELILI